MFRGVKQEAENARRQLRPPDATKVEELIARRMAELMHRGIDVRNRIIYQIQKCCRWIPRVTFGLEGHPLRLAQLFAASVCKEAVESASKMSNVEADRRGTAGAKPDVLQRHERKYSLEVLADLHEGVRHRHQQRIDPFDWTPHPRFCRAHDEQCTRIAIACISGESRTSGRGGITWTSGLDQLLRSRPPAGLRTGPFSGLHGARSRSSRILPWYSW